MLISSVENIFDSVHIPLEETNFPVFTEGFIRKLQKY